MRRALGASDVLDLAVDVDVDEAARSSGGARDHERVDGVRRDVDGGFGTGGFDGDGCGGGGGGKGAEDGEGEKSFGGEHGVILAD